QDQVSFVVELSTTLAPGSWDEVPGIPITSLGGDELRATIPPADAPPGRGFYRVGLSLTP
ncbi:MAG TPA: hypothetical protein VLO11_08535, partial [Luteolibacter sp.]|nr:hypothetical protein [Luteolibacter sp.]